MLDQGSSEPSVLMSRLGRVKLAQFKPRKDFVHQVLPLVTGMVRLTAPGPGGIEALVEQRR